MLILPISEEYRLGKKILIKINYNLVHKVKMIKGITKMKECKDIPLWIHLLDIGLLLVNLIKLMKGQINTDNTIIKINNKQWPHNIIIKWWWDQVNRIQWWWDQVNKIQWWCLNSQWVHHLFKAWLDNNNNRWWHSISNTIRQWQCIIIWMRVLKVWIHICQWWINIKVDNN